MYNQSTDESDFSKGKAKYFGMFANSDNNTKDLLAMHYLSCYIFMHCFYINK